jgi:uncharacterized membrane protein YeaQ/YmgE (transglycosylase-associated protein family)
VVVSTWGEKSIFAKFSSQQREKEKKSVVFTSLVLGAAFSPTGLIIWLIIGLIAGFVASRLMGAGGYGLVGDIIVGLIGAFIGGLLTNLLIPDANFGLIGSIIVAIVGACVLIAILRAVGRAR